MKVLSYEFKSILRHHGYVMSTVVIALLVFAMSFLPRALSNDVWKNRKEKTGMTVTLEGRDYSDTYLFVKDSKINADALMTLMHIPQNQVKKSEKELRQAIEGTDYHGLIVNTDTNITALWNNKSFRDEKMEDYRLLMEKYHFDQSLQKDQIRVKSVEEAANVNITTNEEILGQDMSYHFILAITYISLLYILIIFYGNIIANNIAREKMDRTIEILVTATTSRALILGKLFAHVLLAMVQYSIFIAVGFFGIFMNRSFYPQGLWAYFTQLFRIEILVPFAFFILLGFFIYMCFFVLIGTGVRRIEDIGFWTFPILILLGAVLVASLRFISEPNGIIMTILSYIPLTSVMVMPVRSALVPLPLWKVVSSLVAVLFIDAMMIQMSIIRYKKATHVENKVKDMTSK